MKHLLTYKQSATDWLKALRKNRTNMVRFIISVSVSMVLIIGLIVFFMYRRSDNDNHIYVYYFNPVELNLEAVSRPLPSPENMLQETIAYLHSGPVFGPLFSTWPRDIAPQPEDLVSYVYVKDDTLIAFFTTVFYEMAPLDQSLFKTSFIHTMMSLPNVSEITIFVTDNYRYALEKVLHNLSAGDGEDEYEYYVAGQIFDGTPGVYNDPPISPVRVVERIFTGLHFVDPTGTSLIRGEYEGAFDSQEEQLAIQVLELLISLPDEEYFDVLPVIPPETTVRDLEIIYLLNLEDEEGNTINLTNIHIDLSSDFMTRFAFNTQIAELMIYSIVNTLTEVVTVNVPSSNNEVRVFFLIDTQPVEDFHGVSDFHTYFKPDDSFLQSGQLIIGHRPIGAGEYE